MISAISYKICMIFFIFIVLVVAVFPFYWVFNTAFSGESVYVTPPRLFPKTISLHGFVSAFETEDFFRWIINTFIVAGITVLSAIFVSTGAAYNLSRFKSRWNSFIEYVILGSRMMPGAVLILPTFVMFRYLNLVNSFAALVLANILFALPLCVWILKGFIDVIPPSLEEVAMIDGCSRLESFYRIILPLCIPGIVAVSIFTLNIVWGEYFFARILVIMERNKWVFSLGLTSFADQFETDYAGLMAAVVIYLILPLAVFRFSQYAFVSGMTAGSVKE